MSKELTAVSLFTGAGGMDVGFERAGIKVVFANALMKEAAREGLLPEELRKESILSLIDKRSVFVW